MNMSSKPDADGRGVDVWYTVCPVPAASSLAIARGELETAFRGTDVTLNYIRSHPDRTVREAHYTQSQPNAFREGGNVPPIWAKSSGINLRLIGGFLGRALFGGSFPASLRHRNSG